MKIEQVCSDLKEKIIKLNKIEKWYIFRMLETLISSNDRLTDVAGKQTTHIAELWTEIGLKNEKITKLTTKIYELQDVIKSQRTKDIQEFFDPNRFDN